MKAVFFILATLLLCLFLKAEAHSEPIQFFLNEIRKHQSNKKLFEQTEKIKRTDKYAIKAENDYLKNLTPITNGGTNAEAYWSFDEYKKFLSFYHFIFSPPFSFSPPILIHVKK